ncbi:MAG: SgcJ/EcaC family oxidoreductase [Hyphomonadaceae bacterium]
MGLGGVAANAALAQEERSADDAAIRAVIARMQAAWNASDFAGYMEGFLNPGVIFVSNGRIQRDWQATLDHYVRDYGGAPERRGNLSFEILSIEFFSPDAALLISRYLLDRPENAQEGVNTRLMRRVDGRWVIAMNHVSSHPPGT